MSVYGLSDPFGVLIASKIALNLVLVLTTWRQASPPMRSILRPQPKLLGDRHDICCGIYPPLNGRVYVGLVIAPIVICVVAVQVPQGVMHVK